MIIRLAESGWVPDTWVRAGIRYLLAKRRGQEQQKSSDQDALRTSLSAGPIAVAQDLANEQHYEVDAGFYQQVLGPHLKYSSGFWPAGCDSLAVAEEAMLALTCKRAELSDGQDVLELGCGWGSLTLWMGAQYPGSRITAISNSATQKDWILARAAERGLDNIRVLTADVTEYTSDQTFDRVVSVEMFEHMRNHRELLARIHDWLKPGGKLFVHVFCHHELTYLFSNQGESNWMGRYFFTGGIMPAYDWLPKCTDILVLQQQWAVNGCHYARTLEAWLALADDKRQALIPLLEACYGAGQGRLWLQRWRMFFMACAELFNYGEGKEWFVGHYLFHRPDA